MSIGSMARGAMRRLVLDSEDRHRGLQLAAAVVIAYGASMALGLPEHVWAAMSALIVMRPYPGATFDAGWDRVRGTMVGALCGLLGVTLQFFGANVVGTTLGVVAVVAFASAATSALRSVPVTALIVLAAGDLAGHSALQAAVLRVAQIGIGFGVAVAVALASSRVRAAARLEAGCASLLQRMARQLLQAASGARPTELETQTVVAATRNAMGRLGALAGSADREASLFRRAQPAIDGRCHRRIAGLTSRIFQDTVLLNRVLDVVGQRQDDRLRREVAQAAGAAIASVADVVARRGRPALSALGCLTEGHARGAADAVPSRAAAALLAAPLCLLLEDLQQLCHCILGTSADGTLAEAAAGAAMPRA